MATIKPVKPTQHNIKGFVMLFYKNWDEVIKSVKTLPVARKVVVAAAEDEHALEAVHEVVRDGLAEPILVGGRAGVEAVCARLGLEVAPGNIYDEPEPEAAARLAVALVREGRGDFLMKGALETSQLLKAVVNKETGLGLGKLMSHAAYLEIPRYHKMLVITDGGMVPYPSLEQKKEILEHAVGMLRTLGYDQPKVAVLAGLEKVNPKMKETVEAGALKEMNQRGEITGCLVEGPISMDLALTAEKAALKKYESPVAGEADILLAPDLCLGNCVSKALIEMAGARMAGLVMGARCPIVVTSRASSAEEKYLSLVLAAAH
ncbi:MAG: bifunctional enoyl-CoA hydratase/phosphate acetyltransferase [Candidatus Adiutrix sp.]|nr:bifunctional enoyl-CoA hydratase/phosphate acetyltransferase [Candidatus Adiutrix sp.]